MSEGLSLENKERGPHLKMVALQAKKLGEAYQELLDSGPAGDAEMEYVLENQNSPEANKMKDGKPYFFFGTTEGRTKDLVPCLRYIDGEFKKFGWWFHESWEPSCRAVLRD